MKVLFPFSKLIHSQSNITLQQANVLPGPPVLIPEFHWELPRVNLYGSVMKTTKGYEMYYQCGNAMRVAFARSDDGLRWEKPLVNRADFTVQAHQVVQANTTVDSTGAPDISSESGEWTNLVAGYHMPSVIWDEGASYPYKLFAFGEEGFRISRSEDGVNFHEYDENPAIAYLTYKNPTTEKTWFSDVAPCYKDGEKYIAMVKTYELDERGITRRCVGRAISEDFVHWGPVETIWVPGLEEDRLAQHRGFQWADFYGLCPFAYGDGYLGFIWLFEIEKELPKGTNQGKIEVFLAKSQDGIQWSRVSDVPLIPWDLNYSHLGGMVTTPGAPIFDEKDIKIYYSDNNYEHGMFERDYTKEVDAPTWVIRCATLKKERLVGAYSQNGYFSLCPLSFSGKGIRLNYQTLVNADLSGEITLRWCSEDGVELGRQVVSGDETDLLITPNYDGMAVLELHLREAIAYAVELVEA